MAKGEITCFEQFLLFQQCFQKSFAADVYTSGKGLYFNFMNFSYFYLDVFKIVSQQILGRVNPFPQTTNLQQTTLKYSEEKYGKSL